MNKKFINEEEWQKHNLEMAKKIIERNELRETLLESDEYINWLEQFTIKYPGFSDNDWLHHKKKLPKRDEINVEKLILFFEKIETYANNNYIYPNSTSNYNYSYNIKHNNIGYNIGIVFGQGGWCFCNRIEPKDDFIDYNDIKNNIEQNNTKVIKERLEALKLYISTMLEDNIPRNAIIETTDKVLRKK